MTAGAGPAVELPITCAVLCPPLDPRQASPDWYGECSAALTARSYGALVPPRSPPVGDSNPGQTPSPIGWVAAASAAVRPTPSRTPLLIVAVGDAVSALPNLALALHAARRSVVGYVLVDADVAVRSSGDWPGAPVIYVRSPDAPELGWRLAGLHGWRTVHMDPVAAVLDAAARASGAHLMSPGHRLGQRRES